MKPIDMLLRLTCLTLLVAVPGCSRGTRPELAPVEGTVSLANKPLGGATVVFKPTEGRASRATTDGQGHYELIYIRDIKGARLGSHKVTISIRSELSPKEWVPAKYNTNSTLTAEVKEGKNVIDFELEP